MQRRGKDFSKFRNVVNLLVVDAPIPEKCQDHELPGNLKGIRDLHIEPDWLLLYEKSDSELLLYRMGSHSDLF